MTGQNLQPWLDSFPLQQVTHAVEALHKTWTELTRRRSTGFNRSSKEPQLTLVLCTKVRDLNPRLLGHWITEQILAQVNDDLTIRSRTRTDIEYLWNDLHTNSRVVFEFKKLNASSTSRKHYLGTEGLGRFVNGEYSKGAPLACMVGIFVDEYSRCVLPIQEDLSKEAIQKELSLCVSVTGNYVYKPSKTFPLRADFDTEHRRPADKAPACGTIKIAHFFLGFGYPADSPVTVLKPRRRKA